ncbi:MAG TPA: tail fiber domain-containing protein [Kiritimatiellia bacterium]|jgi:hypothetical protein|nr:tail fiber domain-containing protein [Verrucomicrobiota bacterium]OQC68326.1 MAG: hypothetical protein BWX48_00086 [Verrucomicrobia bacterium ADurb.Bin006]HPV47360.1 tail fiber domain-containing protein [Kiritimatiellia bacterium]NMD21720.1 hypothetical protein [Verrucomicrobiota bacterium]HOR72376.1 tail fiber domain-containing protein [Verrucomicrobiota bacterium]
MRITLSLLSLVLGLTFSLPTGTALAQGTAFTYQGRLDSDGTPFNGSATFKPTLWDAATNGVLLAGNSPTTVTLEVTNGLFTLSLDFGAQFSGADRWLQLEVTTGGGPFTTLTPRQVITPTPYALHARQVDAVGVVGTLSSGQLSGIYSGAVTFNNAGNVFSGDGSGLTGVNAATVGGVNGTDIWKLSGNSGVGAGQFLGTTDNQPLEFRVNGVRALRLEPGVNGRPNVIGGATNNTVATFGATISGGWGNTIQTNAESSTIAGGWDNTIQANAGSATIAGGVNNTIQTNADYAIIGGGFQNTIQTNAWASTIAGGGENTIQSDAEASTIGGGWDNTIQTNAYYSTIGGGHANTIQTNAHDSTIGGGYMNTIQTNADYAIIGGGVKNTIQPDADASTIGGGGENTIQLDADASTIGGGWGNTIQSSAYESTIGGGNQNTIQTNAWASTIGGGANNTIQTNAHHATIPGGYRNEAAGEYSFAAGLRAKANHDGAFVWADSSFADFSSTARNEFNIRAQNGVRIQADKGIHLHALDAPIIVRDWDPFAASAGPGKAGIGRWGLFMEPSALTVGIPSDDVPNRYFRVSKYSTNGTATALMTVTQAGDVTAKSFNPSSDRQLKENFAAVSPEEVLAKVAALPISRWNFKGEAETPHLGPMAQDFHAAFDLGTDDKHIATVDADGVALAAIQGLNQKLEAKTQAAAERIYQLETENTELKQRLERLEYLLINRPNGDRQ